MTPYSIPTRDGHYSICQLSEGAWISSFFLPSERFPTQHVGLFASEEQAVEATITHLMKAWDSHA